jgi:hypothetical protein
MALAPDRPDWRWAQVLKLAQYSDTQALARLRNEDALVQRLFRFKRALDKGLGEQTPALFAAHSIYTNRPRLKLVVEGYLLAGADNAKVATSAWCSEEDVQAYQDSFFDVREGRKHPSWIIETVMGGLPHRAAHPNDITGLIYRYAWLGGIEFMDRFISSDCDISSPKVQLRILGLAKELIIRNSFDIAATMAGRSDIAADTLKIALDVDRDSKETRTSGDDAVGRSVSAFMEQLGISVADPTDPSNLKPPARELREAEYEVHNEAEAHAG